MWKLSRKCIGIFVILARKRKAEEEFRHLTFRFFFFLERRGKVPRNTCISWPSRKWSLPPENAITRKFHLHTYQPYYWLKNLCFLMIRVACFITYSIIFLAGFIGNALFCYIVISSRCKLYFELNPFYFQSFFPFISHEERHVSSPGESRRFWSPYNVSLRTCSRYTQPRHGWVRTQNGSDAFIS